MPPPSSRLVAITILGLTTIVAAGFGVAQYRRAEALTAELSAARTAEKHQIEATAPLIATDQAKSDLAAEGNGSSFPPPEESFKDDTGEEPANNRRPRNNTRRDFGARMEELMKNPETAAAFQTQQRAALDGRYAKLFSMLNLPPAQLNKLKDLLAEKRNAPRDVMQAARGEGMGRDDRDNIRELIQITQSEIDADIRDTIGAQAFDTLTNYEQTQSQRTTVAQLESRLSYSGTPLNSAQAEAMVGILANTSSIPTEGGMRAVGRGGSRGTRISESAIAQAQAVLGPDQLAALQALQAEQEATATLRQAFGSEARRDRDRARPSNGANAGGG